MVLASLQGLEKSLDAVAEKLEPIHKPISKEISDLSGELYDIIEEYTGILQSQELREKLSSEKDCSECNESVHTIFEIDVCEKNPEGKRDALPHGNEVKGVPTCTDEYCKPEVIQLDISEIDQDFLDNHKVRESCGNYPHTITEVLD